MAANDERRETNEPSRPRLVVRVLGPMTVHRDGTPVPLPRSRKVRVLLAFLALASAPQPRSRLCDLLWDVPNDPRGELRWCLSKLRSVVDDEQRRRVLTSGAALISLDLSDACVDALEIARVVGAGLQTVATEQLSSVCELFGGDLLEGVELDATPELSGWLTAQRQRFRTMHACVLGELSLRYPADPEQALRYVHKWLQLAPFERRAHELLLETLAKGGRLREAEAHLAAAIRSFEREGIDWSALRAYWQTARPSGAASGLIQTPAAEERPSEPSPARRRASIAVMPFTDAGHEAAPHSQLGSGLTDDIITRLAKLRVLFVIARGTVYTLSERGIGAHEAGRILNVQYVVSGRIRRHGSRASVIVELAETREARIIWTEDLELAAEGAFTVIDGIVDRIVAAIAKEIETAECERALLKPPSSLDAWEAYHRGLWHMYRFKGPDNRTAEHFFRAALALDPTFARAHAGLSFTHFQNVFLELTADRERQMDLAFETAAESLLADERDPTAHWAMGRALWLRGEQSESLTELQRSIELSPNFALGHYTLGFVGSQSGDPRAAIEAANYSRELSPFDPLQFGMLASRALAHVRLGEIEEAADWALKAVARPNAHAHILAIAATTLALANRPAEAKRLVTRLRERSPAYGVEGLIRAFRLERDTEALFRRSAKTIGFDG